MPEPPSESVTDRRCRRLWHAARARLRRGDPRRAREHLLKLRRLALASDVLPWARHALVGLAALERDAGNFLAARVWQQISLSSDEAELLDPATRDGAAQDALLATEFSTAERLFRGTLWQARESGSLVDAADAWGHLAIAAACRGDWDFALHGLQQALAGHRRVGDQHGLTCDYRNLAEVWHALGRDGLARDCLRSALRCAHRAACPADEAAITRRLRELQDPHGRLLAAQWN